MDIAFDVISDLYLEPEECFNWEGKATSLYCIVAGNVSHDLRTLHQTLGHLSLFYQGIFYVAGTLEYETTSDIDYRTKEISAIIKRLPKVAYLDHHVVILDGVAILGVNGWSSQSIMAEEHNARYKDFTYLNHSIDKMQKHLDVKQIVVVSNDVPKLELWYGEYPKDKEDQITLDYCYMNDTEKKITHWVFGTYSKNVTTTFDGIVYVNNPYLGVRPYWPKRINIKD